MKLLKTLHLAMIAVLLVAMLPVGSASAALNAPPPQAAGPTLPFVPGEVLVTLAPSVAAGTGEMGVSALAGQMGGRVAAFSGSLALLSFDEQADVQALSAQLASQGNVIAAQPNYVFTIPENNTTREASTTAERDLLAAGSRTVAFTGREDAQTAKRTLTRAQLRDLRTTTRRASRSVISSTFPAEYTSDTTNTWGWDRVQADVVWLDSKASPAVCLLDTGVDGKHKDLYGRIINGYDFVNDDTTANDDNGHGTHVAGTIAALANNNPASAIGVSNGKVVAVKVLNAQGWGTSYAIAAGLYYCAARADVRVINMSLGGGNAQDVVEYNALYEAVVNKGKLVVAAAGNNYTADPTALEYPAAWASAGTPAPAGAAGAPVNLIAPGLVSVAAARVDPPTYPVWIDVNHDGIWQVAESFDWYDCALSFTNYGKTVTLVAPGHLIYSTEPTSYPFFNNYYFGDRAGYEYQSGTSMAAPFVSGGAARLLGTRPTLTNVSTPTLKEYLVSSGDELDYSYEPRSPGPDFDPKNAYLGSGYKGGRAQTLTNPYGQPVMAIKAPFCWPKDTADAANPYGPDEDMSGARYFNLARAMERFGVYADINDAVTGLPLNGAVVRTFNERGILGDSVKVGSKTSAVVLLNIPVSSNPNAALFLQVSKSGYTAGYQTYGGMRPNDPGLAGGIWLEVQGSVAVPPSRDISAVLNWLPYADANLDLYLWTPGDSSMPGFISAGWMGHYLPSYPGPTGNHISLDQGALIAPKPGMPSSPYAQLMHDGGQQGFATDILPFDTVTIRVKPGKLVQPWFSGPTITQPYKLYVTDYSHTYAGHDPEAGFPYPHYLNMNAAPGVGETAYDYPFLFPILRVWMKGKLAWDNVIDLSQAYLLPDDNDPATPDVVNPSCTSGNDWWHPADIGAAGVILTPADTACGNVDPNLDYLP